jgi:hypothetical protein
MVDYMLSTEVVEVALILSLTKRTRYSYVE